MDKIRVSDYMLPIRESFSFKDTQTESEGKEKDIPW